MGALWQDHSNVEEFTANPTSKEIINSLYNVKKKKNDRNKRRLVTFNL